MKVTGSESSWNFHSWEQIFQGAKVPGSESSWNFHSWEQIVQGAKVPGTFTPGSESSRETREREFQGAKVSGSESSRKRKFHGITFILLYSLE